MAPAPCAQCGGPNPPGATTCQWCRAALPAQPVVGGYHPLPAPARSRPRSQLWRLFLGLAAAALLAGIVLLASAALIHQQVTSFNRACSQSPPCPGNPEPDPSLGLTVAGIVLMALGGVFGIATVALRRA